LIKTGRGACLASYMVGVGSFPGVEWPDYGINHPPHLVPRFKNEQSYTCVSLCTFVTCYRTNIVIW